MESLCAVEGTEVQFNCSGVQSWHVGCCKMYHDDGMETLTLNASMTSDNYSFTEQTIYCSSGDDEVIAATLTTVGK